MNPNYPPVWRDSGGVQLYGWRYHEEQPQAIEPHEEGWLWSAELQSRLVADGLYLRLYDSAKKRGLPGTKKLSKGWRRRYRPGEKRNRSWSPFSENWIKSEIQAVPRAMPSITL